MAFRETSDFDMPIPGMAMTHELGARPWQSPPQMNTVEEGIDFYISRLVDNKMAGRLLDIIETGVPLTAIAETLTLGGVMQGLHTIDVAVLVNPVLVELMEGLAKNADVPYTVGDEDETTEPDPVLLKKAMTMMSEAEAASEPEEKDETPEEEPKGLMARRGAM
jgi:hypothetical protein|tara:strand:+ start:2017 stop:2508 length:492 start_codon:yes stop_codon:yes gene_type:complete